MNEIKHLEKLIRRLHSRQLHHDVEAQIVKLGKPAYDYLLSNLNDRMLTDYQVTNVLSILRRMMFYDYASQIFIDNILALTQNERIRVRYYVCNLAVSLLWVFEDFPYLKYQLKCEQLKPLLESALAMKLEH